MTTVPTLSETAVGPPDDRDGLYEAGAFLRDWYDLIERVRVSGPAADHAERIGWLERAERLHTRLVAVSEPSHASTEFNGQAAGLKCAEAETAELLHWIRDGWRTAEDLANYSRLKPLPPEVVAKLFQMAGTYRPPDSVWDEDFGFTPQGQRP